MGVDGAGQHFEFEVSVGVGRDDPRDGRVGVVASDDDVATDDGHEAGPGVFQASPEPPVVGHVHEIDQVARLGLGPGARLRVVATQAAGEPHHLAASLPDFPDLDWGDFERGSELARRDLTAP